MTYSLIYKPYGERSILIEWPSVIAIDVLQDILVFKEKINTALKTFIVEVNNAYNSILVNYKDYDLNFENEILKLKKIYENKKDVALELVKRLWKIPVCYDNCFAIDLEELASQKHLTKAELIKRHTQTKYTVYFIGFLPGFLYLGGLDETLYTPRKATPRLQVEKGAVAIGGKQTGVYPNESPGGWQIIGNSPIRFFNITKEAPCFAKAGDQIQFYAIPLKAYRDVKVLVDAGVYQMESEVICD